MKDKTHLNFNLIMISNKIVSSSNLAERQSNCTTKNTNDFKFALKNELCMI